MESTAPSTRSQGAAARPGANAVKQVIERSRPAGFWLRFWAWLFDTTILGLVAGVFNYLVQVAFGVAIVSIVLGLIERGFTDSAGAMLALLTIFLGWIGAIVVAWFLGQLLGWLYYAFFESSSVRATPGKMLLSLWVVDADNQQISFWRATLRHVLKFAALYPAILAFIFLVVRVGGSGSGPSTSAAAWMFAWSLFISPLLFFVFYGMAGWTRERRALHDIGSGCYVVRAQELSPGRAFGMAAGSVAFFLVCWILAGLAGLYRSAGTINERNTPTNRAEMSTPKSTAAAREFQPMRQGLVKSAGQGRWSWLRPGEPSRIRLCGSALLPREAVRKADEIRDGQCFAAIPGIDPRASQCWLVGDG